MKDSRSVLCLILGVVALAGGTVAAQGQQAQSSAQSQTDLIAQANATGPIRVAAAGDSDVQEVVITGYRRSLEEATDAKRQSVNFTDSVFAEDIGKFPDLNIAEALNRIPGVQLTRDVDGEGINISIRGLGTNFTHILLNGAQVQVASNGTLNSNEQDREVDLDLFPTELFTRLDVFKTPTADLLEGGAAGTVNMRSARPFDNPGAHLNYTLQDGYGSLGKTFSPRASLMGSWTNDTFGVLAGIAAVRDKITTTGYETVGWTNPTITYGQCGTTPSGTPPLNYSGVAPTCNLTGGNGWSFPNTSKTTGFGSVPTGVGNGLVAGTPIDANFLLAHNPGLTLEQISDAMIPRLGRDVYIAGEKNRVAEILSFEWRPNDQLHTYLDTMYAKADRDFNRLDMDLVGRSGAIIPLNEQVDSNDVVTSATFANAQYFLEDRPYTEDLTFYRLNPGIHWEPASWVAVDYQMDLDRSVFLDQSPTVLINTPLGQGVTVNYTNNGGQFPNSTNTNINLDNPNAGWTWTGGRVNVQNEKRDTQDRGGHLDVQFGKEPISAKIGAAFDDSYRTIIGLDNSLAWQQAICGGGGTFQPAPAPQPACVGGPGSSVPQSALSSYIFPGPGGFIQVDTNRLFKDSNYWYFDGTAPVAAGAATGASSGGVHEKTWGTYIELAGDTQIFGNTLRGDAGVRYIKTIQTISGPYITAGVVQQGPWQNLISDYDKILPSMNLAYNLRDNVITRFSASKTLSRPNPSSMLPATTFTDPSGEAATAGNPKLQPYTSQNLDLGGEWYTGAEGYVGLDLFQKRLDGFTVNGITTEPFDALGIPLAALSPTIQAGVNSRGGPDAATVQVTQQVNASGILTIRGLEATWVQPLGRFVDVLDGFGFTANWTHTSQSATGAAPAQAIGISPNTYNTTLYYEKHGLSVRVSYVWLAGQIASSANQNGITLAQLFNDSYGQLDMSASYQLDFLPSSPQIVLNGINLTSAKQRTYFEFSNAAYQYYNPGYQILLGIRGKW